MQGLTEQLGLVRERPLVPGDWLDDLSAHRFDVHGFVLGVLRSILGRNNDGHGTVTGNIAVIEAKWCRHHARIEVVVHRHRVLVDGPRVPCRHGPVIRGDSTKYRSIPAVALEIIRGVHRDPVTRTHCPIGRALTHRTWDTAIGRRH